MAQCLGCGLWENTSAVGTTWARRTRGYTGSGRKCNDLPWANFWSFRCCRTGRFQEMLSHSHGCRMDHVTFDSAWAKKLWHQLGLVLCPAFQPFSPRCLLNLGIAIYRPTVAAAFQLRSTWKDVATVDAMYDKYDIPYDTIWPVPQLSDLLLTFGCCSSFVTDFLPRTLALVASRKRARVSATAINIIHVNNGCNTKRPDSQVPEAWHWAHGW